MAPDETDVCVIAPLKTKKHPPETSASAWRLSLEENPSTEEMVPRKSRLIWPLFSRDLKLAVAGLKPVAAADGCNYGNPDNPEHYFCFDKGINGLNKACKIPLYGEQEPMAVVAGNVSLKNTYISGGERSAA